LLVALAAGTSSTGALIRATSACFLAVYVLALASAATMLAGRLRAAAVVALALVSLVAVLSSTFLLVPAVAALAALGFRSTALRRAAVATRHEPTP
jgi:amino acid efflux transporter